MPSSRGSVIVYDADPNQAVASRLQGPDRREIVATGPKIQRKKVRPAVLAASALLMLAGCTTTPHDVVSIATSNPTEVQRTQADAAKEMVGCLGQAGALAVLVHKSGNQADLDFGTGQSHQLFQPDGSSTVTFSAEASTSARAAQWERWDAMIRPYLVEGQRLDQYLLFIGDKDYSEVFNHCVEETGYTPPVDEPMDPAEELAVKRRNASAGAEWARCARENGFPWISDPDPPVADGMKTWGQVWLPFETTVEELSALLALCPNFDREAQEAFDRAYQDPGSGWEQMEPPPQLFVQLEIPENYEWGPEWDPETQRIQTLREMLVELEMEYQNEVYDEDGHWRG
ncbi:MAG: hypothetical protein FWG16_06205 [Micrococcales bacterium]|nr:hypothetical protein [Micrococcales bacterium]